jgi:hypothetical protein
MDLKPTIVIDDVVPVEFQNKIQDIMKLQFWNFIPDMSYANYEMDYPSYGFNHMIKHPESKTVGQVYDTVSVPIINAVKEKTGIEINDIYFNRAFLQVPLNEKFLKQQNGVHIDIHLDHYACVYYVNDSDGDTIVYEQTKYDTPYGSQNVELVEHKRVTPKKGRIVIFDGARYHCSSQPKNSYRMIINFDLI